MPSSPPSATLAAFVLASGAALSLAAIHAANLSGPIMRYTTNPRYAATPTQSPAMLYGLSDRFSAAARYVSHALTAMTSPEMTHANAVMAGELTKALPMMRRLLVKVIACVARPEISAMPWQACNRFAGTQRMRGG